MKKNTHGGAREGAGRKPLGRIKRVVSFAPETFKELTSRAQKSKLALGQVIDGLVAPERRPE